MACRQNELDEVVLCTIEGVVTDTVLSRRSRLGVNTSSSSEVGRVRFFLGETRRAVYRSDIVCVYGSGESSECNSAKLNTGARLDKIIYATRSSDAH